MATKVEFKDLSTGVSYIIRGVLDNLTNEKIDCIGLLEIKNTCTRELPPPITDLGGGLMSICSVICTQEVKYCSFHNVHDRSAGWITIYEDSNFEFFVPDDNDWNVYDQIHKASKLHEEMVNKEYELVRNIGCINMSTILVTDVRYIKNKDRIYVFFYDISNGIARCCPYDKMDFSTKTLFSFR